MGVLPVSLGGFERLAGPCAVPAGTALRAACAARGLDDQLPQLLEIALARRGPAPHQAQGALGLRLLETDERDLAARAFLRDADLGQQRQPHAVGDHLHERGEARGAEGVDLPEAAIGQRLVAQAVALLEQQQAVRFEERGAGAHARLRPPPLGHGKEELVVEEPHRFEIGFVDWQRQHENVEPPFTEFRQQHARLRFAHMQFEIGMPRLQRHQQLREQVGGDGGDHAEPQRPGKQRPALARVVGEILHLAQDAGGAPRHFLAGFREGRALRPPLDQLEAQRLFEVLDLHREGGLRDRTVLRRFAEVAEPRQRLEVAQLLEGDHGPIIFADENSSIERTLLIGNTSS